MDKPQRLSFAQTAHRNRSNHPFCKHSYMCDTLPRYDTLRVFIEKLNGFLDSKSKALNQKGRNFRRIVHRIPCGELRDWIVRKLTFGDCHVEYVPAAYTSKCAEAFWSDLFESSHQAAALMIARRGLGLGFVQAHALRSFSVMCN